MVTERICFIALYIRLQAWRDVRNH